MIRCAVCDEFLARDEIDPDFVRHAEMGHVAEMHDPDNSERGGVVHTECGLRAGWEVS